MIQPPSLSASCTSSLMAPMVLLVFILAMVGGSDAAWCVCKQDASSSAQQKAIDYACGAGADCKPISQNGPCYNPNTVAAHCSYAANSYYQRNGQNQQACDFSGTAQLVPSDPSSPGCTYPATPSAAGSSGTPSNSTSPTTPGSALTPGTGTGTGTGTGSGSGSSLTPSSGTGIGTGIGTGTGGSTGVLGGLGPSGVGPDGSDAANMGSSLFLTVLASAAALALLC